jgi:hypothetical protein
VQAVLEFAVTAWKRRPRRADAHPVRSRHSGRHQRLS